MAAAQVQGDMGRVEYYAVPTSGAQHPALQVSPSMSEGEEEKVCCLLVVYVRCIISVICVDNGLVSFCSQQLQYQQYQLTTGNAPCSLEVIANATNAQILANRAAGTTGANAAATTTLAPTFQPQLLLPSPQLGKCVLLHCRHSTNLSPLSLQKEISYNSNVVLHPTKPRSFFFF